MIEVRLTTDELMMAASAASLRHVESIMSGRPDRHGAARSDDGLGKHFEGACGEIAYCKARNVHWSASVNSFKGPDVGQNVQIRTRSRHDYDLIVRADDSDLDWFVLVTGKPPTFIVRGYIRGREAKQAHWLKNHGGHGDAYFVPVSALKPIGDAKAAA